MRKFWKWIKYQYEWHMYKWIWGLSFEQVHYWQNRVKEVEHDIREIKTRHGKYAGWEMRIDNPFL